MKITKTTLPMALAGLLLTTSATVAAVTTKSFVLDSAKVFAEGELDGAAVHSDGSVRPGASTERVEIENVPLAYSVARRKGTTFIGTGTNGAVFKLDGKKVEQLADTGELLVSSLAIGRDGALYAGTVPNGRIYRVEPKSGDVKRFAELDGAKHIWALHYDDKRGRLIAATGPEGKLFSIDSKGRAKEIYKTEASHIMTLAGDGKGNLFVGTSDAALVLRITLKNRVEVLHDFPGNEITDIDYHDGKLAVVANEFKTAPGTQFKAGSAEAGKAAQPSARPRPGTGALWRIDEDGRTEALLSRQDTHFTSVQWGAEAAIFAGGGNQGRIFRVEPDGSYSIWVDVEERQVLALDLRSERPLFVTGDSAAVYRVGKGGRGDAVWTSKPLDAKFASKWGRLTWRATGRFAFETRSGNTKEPGDAWSAWSKPMQQPGHVASAPARFIQLRAKLPKDDTAVLRAVELFYLPQNQRARVSDIQGSRPPLKRGEAPRQPPPPTTAINLTWKVDNPDGDPLRYRVAYRREDQSLWREMFPEQTVLSQTKHTWDTSSIPDGYYVVRVEASDEEANPDALALKSSATSEPIRVDNHPPRIDVLEARKGRVRGRVVDRLGPIARIQMAVDAGSWRDIFPTDALLDDADERFDVAIGELEPGPHIIAIRAFDAAGNQANREINVKTGR